jgi:hypothetical protein
MTEAISPSNLEKNLPEVATNQVQSTETRLTALQTNGELDAEKVNARLAALEKRERWFKWAAFLFGLFSLLSIAAIVGLAYDVDHLGDDIQLSPISTLVSKKSGTPVGTSQVVSSTHANNLYKLSPAELEKITSITVPDGDGYHIARVAAINLKPNISATVITVDGKKYEITSEGFFVPEPPAPDAITDTTNTTTGNPSRRRRLLRSFNGTGIIQWGVRVTAPESVITTPTEADQYYESCIDTCKSMCDCYAACNLPKGTPCQLSNPNDCVDCCNTQCYASCPSECGGY